VVAPGHAALLAQLRRFRRHLIWRRTLDLLGRGIPVAFLAATVCLLFALLFGQRPSTPTWLVAPLLLTLLLLALWHPLFRRPSLAESARLLDRLARTKNRAATALDLHAGSFTSPVTPLQALAMKECESTLAKLSLPSLPPLPSALRWLWLPPLVSLLLLALLPLPSALGPPSPAATPEHPLLPLVDDFLDAFQPADAAPDPAVLPAMAEAMVAELQRPATTALPEVTHRALLQRLNALESLLRSLQNANQPAPFTPAELSALAAALAAMEASPAPDATAPAALAGQLARLMDALGRQTDPSRALDELTQALNTALDPLSDDEKTALAQQMQEAADLAASGEMQALQEKLREIAELLRQQAASQPSGSPPSDHAPGAPSAPGASHGTRAPLDRETLRQMLEALDQWKEQLQRGDGNPGNAPPSPGNGTANLPLPGHLLSPDSGEPTGQPGADAGTGAAPEQIADEIQTRAEGPAQQLSGQPLPGASSADRLPTAGDRSTAATPYRELFDALESERAEAIQREEIPIGSRLFLRRYFESIRPE